MYLRDVQDHSQQALEFIKSDQGILSGMIDLYLSLISQNERQNKGFGCDFDNLYASDSHCWDVRDEFSAYARTWMGI